MNFESPDAEVFPSVEMAREVCRRGGSAAVVYNAANERAVQGFLEERLPFPGIFDLVARALDAHRSEPVTDLEQILEVDHRTREEIDAWIPS